MAAARININDMFAVQDYNSAAGFTDMWKKQSGDTKGKFPNWTNVVQSVLPFLPNFPLCWKFSNALIHLMLIIMKFICLPLR